MNEFVTAVVQKADYLLGRQFADEVRVHAERHCAKIERLRKAAECGRGRKIREAQHLVLTSYSSKLVCLVQSAKASKKITPDWVRETAGALDPWTDPGEPVTARLETKSSGEGWRPIVAFGPKRKALQSLCREILKARHAPDPCNFLWKGRGSDQASDHIVGLINEGTYSFFIVADIKDFFRSVQQQILQEATGLPEAVIKNCLLIGPNVPIHKTHYTTGVNSDVFDGAVREGLPHGSRTSNIVASLLLGPALRSLTSADRIIIHGDDIAVAVRNKKEGEALQKALSEMLASHPAGPFRLKHNDLLHIHDGFDFLKYRHKRDGFTGDVWLRPAGKSYQRYMMKVINLTVTHSPSVAIRKVARFRYHWMRAFPRWRWNWSSKWLLWHRTMEAVTVGHQLKK